MINIYLISMKTKMVPVSNVRGARSLVVILYICDLPRPTEIIFFRVDILIIFDEEFKL
jgi:hypothetical protein